MQQFEPRLWRQLVESDYQDRLKFFDELGVRFQWLNVLDEVVDAETAPPEARQFAPHTFRALLSDACCAEMSVHPLGPYNAIHLVLDELADQLIVTGFAVPELPYD